MSEAKRCCASTASGILATTTSTLIATAYCVVDAVLAPDPIDDPDLTTDASTWRRYEGDYIMTEASGYQTNVRVYMDGERLMAAVTDPAFPEWLYRTELIQAYLDTFSMDADGDGWTDMDFTFCPQDGEPGIQMWMRNRTAVGERKLTPRRAGNTVAP